MDGWPRQIKAENGTVTLQQPPERIVSTSVTLTGSLLAIDAPVVGSGAGAPGSRFTDAQGFSANGEILPGSGRLNPYISVSPISKVLPVKHRI